MTTKVKRCGVNCKSFNNKNYSVSVGCIVHLTIEEQKRVVAFRDWSFQSVLEIFLQILDVLFKAVEWFRSSNLVSLSPKINALDLLF